MGNAHADKQPSGPTLGRLQAAAGSVAPGAHLHLDMFCGQVRHGVPHRLGRPLHIGLDDDRQRALAAGLAALLALASCRLGRLQPAQRGAAVELGVRRARAADRLGSLLRVHHLVCGGDKGAWAWWTEEGERARLPYTAATRRVSPAPGITAGRVYSQLPPGVGY